MSARLLSICLCWGNDVALLGLPERYLVVPVPGRGQAVTRVLCDERRENVEYRSEQMGCRWLGFRFLLRQISLRKLDENYVPISSKDAQTDVLPTISASFPDLLETVGPRLKTLESTLGLNFNPHDPECHTFLLHLSRARPLQRFSYAFSFRGTLFPNGPPLMMGGHIPQDSVLFKEMQCMSYGNGGH